jgi:hypothetical protein
MDNTGAALLKVEGAANWGAEMKPYTPREKAKITAGAVAAVVMTGMLAVIVLAFLMAP